MVSVKRSALRASIALSLMALAFLAILPHLLSSRVVYGALLDRLKAEQFRLSVESVELAWFSPVQLGGVSIEQEGKPDSKLLQIREITAEKGLLGFLLSHRQLGKWQIIEPVIDVELLQDGSNVQDLARALGGDRQATKKDLNEAPIDIDIRVENASVVVRKGNRAAPLVVVPSWDFDVHYRSASGEPMLTIEPTRWLDHVKLTPELMNMGLEFALPTLAKSAWLDGEISLDSGKIEVPLKQLINSQGAATIEFHNVRVGLQQPAMIAVASMLAKIAGRESKSEVVVMEGSKVLVTVQDRSVSHEGLMFGLPKLDPRLQVSTSGRVGMVDRTLEGVMAFPVPLQWLARTDEVRKMGVPTVSLPLTGTLEEPQVQWMAMRQESADLLSQIRGKLGDDATTANAAVGILEGLAGGSGDDAIRATTDLLGKLRELRKKRLSEQTNEEARVETSAETSDGELSRQEPAPGPRRPLRDLLRRRNAE